MSVTNTEISDKSNAERLQIRKERLALLRNNKAFIIGTSILGFWILCAIFGKFVTPFAVDEQNYEFVSVAPNGTYWFGTDPNGQTFSLESSSVRDSFWSCHLPQRSLGLLQELHLA